MNEWEFTGDVASWVNEILQRKSDLPFSRAKVEQTTKGSAKRRDLTLLGKDGGKILTGEIRFPWRHDGGTPYSHGLKEDARTKARRAGSPFFFTWNVNEFVLWETYPPKTSWIDQPYKPWTVTRIHREEHLELPMTQHAVKSWLDTFLDEYGRIIRGAVSVGIRPPDEKFIDDLEQAIHLPIVLGLEQLSLLYKQARFRSELDKWMREEQGWTIFTDPEGIQENLERASKFACYALVNKVVFHEALLKRYRDRMEKLDVPDHIDRGESLRSHLEAYFARAKEITRDYETVFGEEHTPIGNRIPFYADAAVPHWRVLIRQIHRFDFSRLDYEIIGSIFERLISPEERQKFGQFYTRVEVVDLINSFCIRTGRETILDPACGGGTFLVRAYARKRELDAGRRHGELLRDLFGIDVSHFATHLTTINLATRDLIDDENYPQIGRSDFFDIESQRRFIELPTHIETRGLGKAQRREVYVPLLDAVVGNPPYIQQEEIPKSKRKGKHGPEHGTKEYYLQVAAHDGAQLSGRSDIHCYFWPHATSFLKDNGYLCFLTSSQWLDIEYGFKLQDWILRNFEVVAVLESIDEPWFVGARVVTAVTILHRQKDHDKRMNNTVRFVQLRRSVCELLPHDDASMAAVVLAADGLRDEILSLAANTTNERYRARLVRQADLWDQGIALGILMGKGEDDIADAETEHQIGEYYGGKWGVYLRGPDIWFDLVDGLGERLTPLGKIADVRFGVKTGRDCFFFPRDCTQQCLKEQNSVIDFEAVYGAPRKEVESGKVKLVMCGEQRGLVRPIESKYLEPEVHSLMEVHTYEVGPRYCSNCILLLSESRSELSRYAREYVTWGESLGYHTNPTCARRATETHEWYDLTRHKRPDIIVPKIQQYRLTAFSNPNKLYQNSSLLGIYDVPKDMVDALCAVLNSTIAVLSDLPYGWWAREPLTEGCLLHRS